MIRARSWTQSVAPITCAIALLCAIPAYAQTPAQTGAEKPAQASAPAAAQNSTPAANPAPRQAVQASGFDPAPTPGPKADIIYVHANVYTSIPANTSFGSILRQEAIAVRADRIQAVGKNVDIEKLKGPQTEVVDLGGHFVMAGFNDAHLHLSGAGLQKLNVDLVGVKSLEEMRERVRARVETAVPGEWILGGGWDETMWPVKVTPNRWDLDEVSNGHPVFLDRVDGHIAVANTRALQLASITLASRDPEGGQIDRDTNGQPTGILRETAVQAVLVVIPKPSHDRRRRGVELALADLAAAWRHVRAGLLHLGRFQNLRRARKRRQTHGSHFGMAPLRRAGHGPHQETRFPSPGRSAAAHWNAQRLYGRLARIAYRRHARALRRRSQEFRPAAI